MTIAKASPRRVLPSKISKHRYNTNNSASPLRWLWEVSLCPFFSRNTRRRSFLFFWSFFLRNSISDWSFFVLFCIAWFACGCYLDITNILANPAFLFCSLLPYRHHIAAFSCKMCSWTLCYALTWRSFLSRFLPWLLQRLPAYCNLLQAVWLLW